jgi:hypothetical protein
LRAGQAAIDGQRGAWLAGDVDRGLADEQLELLAAEVVQRQAALGGLGQRAPQAEAGQGGGGAQALGGRCGGWGVGGMAVVSRRR